MDLAGLLSMQMPHETSTQNMKEKLFVAILVFIIFGSQTTATTGSISPTEDVTVPGGNVSYTCSNNVYRPDALTTKFKINDTVLNETVADINGVGVDTRSAVDHATLDLSNVSEDFNNTQISCVFVFGGGDAEYTDFALLQVQGVLSIGPISVTITDTLFYLTWPKPFTLDITGEDPDIVGYCACVDVIDSTSSMTLHSDCEITNNEFYYLIPSDAPCTEYIFNVRGINAAGMGEPSTTMYRAIAVSEVDDVKCISVPSSRDVDSEFVYLLIVNEPVCEAQVMSLIDYYTNDIVNDVDVTSTEENITLLTTRLQFNRRYNATVMVNNSGGSVMLTVNISSHPIVTATVITEGGAIILLTEYCLHSYESGALYLFFSLTDDTWALVALNREDSDHYTLPFSLPAGRYRVSVYDTEHNRTILSGVAYPAYTVNEFTVSGAQDQGQTFQPMFSRLDGCTVTTVQRCIDVACSYSSDSGATGFQVIVQRQNQGDKLYVSQTDQMLASVMVEESGMYLVIVLAIEGAAGITTDSAAEYAETVNVDTQDSAGSNIGTAVAVPLVVVVMLIACAGIFIIVAYALKRKNRVYYDKTNGTNRNGCEEPKCPPDLYLELSPQYPAKGQLDSPDLYLTDEIVSSSVPPDHGMPNQIAIETERVAEEGGPVANTDNKPLPLHPSMKATAPAVITDKPNDDVPAKRSQELPKTSIKREESEAAAGGMVDGQRDVTSFPWQSPDSAPNQEEIELLW